MLPLFYICPPAYYACKAAAAVRHEMLRPVLGLHAHDSIMRKVYPL